MDSLSVQGVTVPKLGLGTWQISGKRGIATIKQALDLGYRHIDTARIYDNEDVVGAAITQSSVARADIFLTTKVWFDSFSREALFSSVEASLQDLQTDYVDLLLLHWPTAEVPLAETIEALVDVQKQGKARLIGVSNFTAAMIEEAIGYGAGLACNQVEYHPYLNQKTVLDKLRQHSMFLTAYSPLARGALFSDPVIKEIARTHNKSPAQVALRWLIQQPDIAAIPKAARPEHMKSNLEIFDFALSPEEMARLHELARPDGRIGNPEWAPEWDAA